MANTTMCLKPCATVKCNNFCVNPKNTEHTCACTLHYTVKIYVTAEERAAVEANKVIYDSYKSLEIVLDKAFDRASIGKGRARHADNNRFEDQPIVTDLLAMKSIAGAVFQIRKKALEACTRMTGDQAINELYDVIVYAAGAVIALEKMK